MSDLTKDMDALFYWFFSPLVFGECAVSLDCPCKRSGKGCIHYSVSEFPPYYYCWFTREPAYVPRADDDSGVVGGMYG